MQIQDMRSLWKEVKMPILYRQGRGMRLKLRLSRPDQHVSELWPSDEYRFLFRKKHHKPKWEFTKKHWELPYSWLDFVTKHIVSQKGALYLIQPCNSLQVCSRSCQEAQGFECECSCMGAQHGSNNIDFGWFEITDCFAVKSEGNELSCRLIVSTE